MQYKIEILKKVDKAFIKQWNMLWKNAENANVYNSYEWFQTCLATYDITDYEIHACYKQGRLVALLPLQQYRVFGVKVYGTFAKEQLVDTAFLMEKYDRTLFKQLFGSVLSKKYLYLQKIDSKAAVILHKLYPDFLFSLISVNPTVPLSGDPYKSVAQSTLYRIKKILKKNPDTFRLEAHKSDLDIQLQAMLKLQESSSKKERKMDIFAEEKTKKYYRNLINYCSKFVRINLLYLNNEPIAYELGFNYKDRYLGDQISYHKEYKKYMPGKMMVYYLLDTLKKRKIIELDQGGGISSYKMSFTNNYKILYNVYYSTNPLVMLWWEGINITRRIKQVVRPKRHTRDHEFLFRTVVITK